MIDTSLQDNMAEYIRRLMKQGNKSFSEFAEELEISRNALYSYSIGAGNPTLSKVSQLSEKLEVSPAVILGLEDQDLKETMQRIMETIQDVQELTEEDRHRFTELFLEMVKLWDKE